MKKLELLMPAGNPEAFHAALEGGADAVYVGMKEFNARGRAFNFHPHQLSTIIKIAHDNNIRVYVTLNTLIKNKELPKLIDSLHILEQIAPDAVIIQDWGVYHLIKKHFKSLTVHASTQMGNHNSLGAFYSNKMNIERIILARELTMSELEEISKKSKIELEVFVHGALCYSFSGMCLFSSYLGGQSANRGLCKQPCRRSYQTDSENGYVFNLKDNQQLEIIEKLKDNGIKSLKVEGRLKSAEYVYRVASAYRDALDNESNSSNTGNLSNMDLTREKTGYFLRGNIKNAISTESYSGKHIGEIIDNNQNSITVNSTFELKKGNRIRIRTEKTGEGKAFKIRDIKKEKSNVFLIKGHIPPSSKPGDKVYLTEFREKKFASKLPDNAERISIQANIKFKNKLLNKLQVKNDQLRKEEIYLRIDSIKWLRKVNLSDIHGLLLNLSEKEWDDFKPDAGFLQRNLNKVIIELPRFIPEGKIRFYQTLVQKLQHAGYNQYSVSHLSQKELFDEDTWLMCNEHVYTLNDAAAHFVKQEGMKRFIYPLENEADNLINAKHKDGIVPVYFTPALFYSRMPVSASDFISEKGEHFHKITRNGLTNIYPDKPVSLLQYKDKLRQNGFKRYLIDLSFEKPSGNRLETILKRFQKSSQMQPSTNFNFVKGFE